MKKSDPRFPQVFMKPETVPAILRPICMQIAQQELSVRSPKKEVMAMHSTVVLASGV